MQLGGTGDENDPWLLGEQPGKRDLSWRHLFLLRELTNQINGYSFGVPYQLLSITDQLGNVLSVPKFP
jgi:hypothetical protein